MNIDNLYRNAEVYLEMSREKFDSQNYESSLSSAVKAYEHNRELIQRLFALRVAEAQKEPAGTGESP